MTADAAIPAELEQPLIAVETCLTQLGEALAARDPAGIERHSAMFAAPTRNSWQFAIG